MSVVVVGSGIAGLTAALRAQELGASVLLLDRGLADGPGSNTRMSGGAYHPAYLEATADPAAMVERVRRLTDGTADPALLSVWAERVGPALNWLKTQGVTFIRGGPLPYQRYVFAPPRPNLPGDFFPGRSGDAATRQLLRQFTAKGGRVLWQTRASALIWAGGTVRGVVAGTADGEQHFPADVVILCDGGFQGNLEMLREYITPRPELLLQRGAGTGTGDGIRMAQAVGAAVSRMERFYGHVLCRDARERPILSPFPHVDALLAVGLLVDGRGLRLTDEGGGGVAIANALATHEDPTNSWVIFDEAGWESTGRTGIVPPNPFLPEHGGTLVRAGSVSELANLTGIDPAGLSATFIRLAEGAQTGQGADLSPARTGPLRPLSPPYLAIPVAPGITYTMGGVVIDPQARVLSADGQFIPGLFAAGGTAGGLEGGPRAGYAGGLAQAVVFGLIAGEGAAALVTSRTGAAAAAPGPLPASSATPPSSVEPYPAVRWIVRHGAAAATALGIGAPLLGSAVWLTGGSFWAAIAGLLAGPVLWGTVKSYSELAHMVSFLLLPDAPHESTVERK